MSISGVSCWAASSSPTASYPCWPRFFDHMGEVATPASYWRRTSNQLVSVSLLRALHSRVAGNGGPGGSKGFLSSDSGPLMLALVNLGFVAFCGGSLWRLLVQRLRPGGTFGSFCW
ncbi:hypothetical protein GOP47_0031036 [Adiantum capillus-veneris]|nr:hypothetical protein GOP47_0031036 [Adiantum capillus-veneris]